MFGRKERATLRAAARIAITMRTTLTPPAVEPEHPPTNIKIISSIFAGGSHRSKSAEVYPVVVMIETAWKVALRINSCPGILPVNSTR